MLSPFSLQHEALACLFVLSSLILDVNESDPFRCFFSAGTRWLNPLYYGLEAGMANEFHDLDFDCVGASLVPSGPGYATDAGNFVCSVQGSVVGENFVGGDAYVRPLGLSPLAFLRLRLTFVPPSLLPCRSTKLSDTRTTISDETFVAHPSPVLEKTSS